MDIAYRRLLLTSITLQLHFVVSVEQEFELE